MIDPDHFQTLGAGLLHHLQHRGWVDPIAIVFGMADPCFCHHFSIPGIFHGMNRVGLIGFANDETTAFLGIGLAGVLVDLGELERRDF
jgi:hypothetical protein